MNKNLINKYCRKLGFEVHGTGYLQSIEKSTFKEDPFLKQKEMVSNPSTIFDIGANRGDTVIQYKLAFPQSKIYAFEPFPGSFDVLQENTKVLDNIFIYQKAVGEKLSRSAFFVNNSVDTNSLLPSKKSGLSSDKQVENKEQITVDVLSIDQFCRDNAITEIDILKLDIQGGELNALKGCADLLHAKKIKLIYLEVYFIQQYINHPLFHDVSKFLEGHNYYVQDFYSPIYGKGSIAWCDAIFLPS